MYDKLFDDERDFIKFFKKNDSEENRKAILKTDRLRYFYCKHINNIPEIAEQITSSTYSLMYCMYVNDNPEKRGLIKDDKDTVIYCECFCDLEEVWSKITTDEGRYEYCKKVTPRKKLFRKIRNSKIAAKFCVYVQDVPRVRHRITDSADALFYCLHKGGGTREVRDKITEPWHITLLCAKYPSEDLRSSIKESDLAEAKALDMAFDVSQFTK